MSPEDLRAKFDENAGAQLSSEARRRLADAIARLDTLPDASVIAALATAGVAARP
jgi:hypothetical protein